MYPQKQLKERIDALFISVQSISFNDYSHFKSSKYNWNIYLKFGSTYTTQLNFIHKIYKLILQLQLQEITTNILQGYKDSSNITLQYLRKYKYLYQKTQHYYKTTSSNTNINIERLALTNLYVINQIYHFGFYFLFKYLLHSKL